ncbi:MAG TPA: GMC family oxidoreductase N-terminal domain-containing protein, partial [Burkholderiales bacterium]|nr:GMC family oxidoreductase N-terminal domain-containing protein [Burkholderiales bacterium]
SFVGQLLPGRVFPVPRGKAVGGSSAVNGTYFIRGRREDFDDYAAAGNHAWSYDSVLPYFIKSERDLDYEGAGHGTAGPMPVKRAAPAQYLPVTRAFVAACRGVGFGDDPDKNLPGPEGVGPIPRNCIEGVRMNAALTYLDPCLGRGNLDVMDRSLVRRVIFDGRRAVGVELEREGRVEVCRGGETVLCASGIKSPHLLMLSGVGPAEALRRHGIPVVCDSPAVGTQLMDHPSAAVLFRVRADAVPQSALLALQACLNFTGEGSATPGDLQISCAASLRSLLSSGSGPAGSERSALGQAVQRVRTAVKAARQLPLRLMMRTALQSGDLQMVCQFNRPHSRGTLTLKSADPREAPAIDFNYLSDPADLPRMRQMVRTAARLLESPPFLKLGAVRTNLGDADLGDAALERWIRANMGTAFHTSSTARMGPEGDAGAVVDQYGRVRGVEGLRVADLSILPATVRRGPAATAIMIGERVAAFFN